MVRKRASLIPEDVPLKKAEKLRRTKDPTDFKQSVLSEKEFMGIKLPPRKWVLEGLIVEESMTIANGFRGCGKSWLMLSMANEVSWGGRLGPWNAPKARNVMVIDGEMPLGLLQERMRLLNLGRDISEKKGEMWVYPEAYAYRIGLKRASILDPVWRKRVGDAIKDLGVEMLILDNLSSLAPGIDENDKMPFDPVNRWLLEMRFNGVAIVMTHHVGKTGDQRGTSAHEDHVDTALILERPPGLGHDTGCRFNVYASKDRAFITGGITHQLMLKEVDGGRLEFEWRKESSQKVAQMVIERGGGWKEARELGISARTFYRAKRKVKGNSQDSKWDGDEGDE